MKITTQITVTLDKADGSQTIIGKTISKTVGDNPIFHRNETRYVVNDACIEFAETHHLNGTSDL